MAGLGDTVLTQWLSRSPAEQTLKIGAGWNWIFPTASDVDLGTGKTSLGPSVVVANLGEKYVFGVVASQFWSIGGAASRNRVSFMDLQYIYKWRVNPVFNIGAAPNIKWNQVTGQWNVPIGLGFDVLTKVGKSPVRFIAEAQYYLSQRDRPFDPEWNFRFGVVPIVQAPEWANRPLLGGCGRCGHCSNCCK